MGGLSMTAGKILQAINATRVPSSQVMAALYGYLGRMRRTNQDVEAERIAARIMRDRQTAIRYHQAAKQAIVLSSIRELAADASEIDDFIEQMDASEADSDLVAMRRGMMRLVRTMH